MYLLPSAYGIKKAAGGRRSQQSRCAQPTCKCRQMWQMNNYQLEQQQPEKQWSGVTCTGTRDK